MKYLKLLFLVIIASQVEGQSGAMSVTNSLTIERKNELVVLKRDMLVKKLGAIGHKQFIQVKLNGQPKLVQFDDLDADGVWDEAVMLQDFKPGEALQFQLSVSDKPAAIKAKVLAHVRQRHKLPDQSFGGDVAIDTMPYNNAATDFTKQKLPPYLTEGPAWENDKIGFRKYFDTRNTNDIWGKITDRMVLDEVGVDPSKIYHNYDSGWGMDILKVGKSLGAGAIALKLPLGNGLDTTIRPATNARVIYKKVADGPLRAMFRISYEQLQPVPGMEPISLTETISIWGGQYFFQNEVSINHAPAGAKLVTGTMNFYSNSYEVIDTAGMLGLLTHDKQSEYHDMLGLGVIASAENVDGTAIYNSQKETIQNTYAMLFNINDGKPIAYRYLAVWQQTLPTVKDKSAFEQLAKNEMIKMNSGLIIQ